MADSNRSLSDAPYWPGRGASAGRPQGGFTMVELIVVIVLIGILGAVAGMRFFNRDGYDVPASSEQMRTLLRHAQKVAIARNAPVFVRFELNRVSLCHGNPMTGCPGDLRVRIPGAYTEGDNATRTHCGAADWYCIGRPANLAVAIAPVTDWLRFDGLGRPTRADGTAGGLTVTISAAGGGSRNVVVTEETGYVR